MIDKALVAATFAETKSKRKTAQKLGISEEHVYGILRGMADRCVRCGKPVKNGLRQCADCKNFDRERMQERRAERRRTGKCIECGEPRSAISIDLCDHHRQMRVDRHRKHDAKKKRHENIHRECVNWKGRRLTVVRRTYGQDAADLWQDCDGCCQLCGARHGEKSVQVHHIDENKKNGARENLAILCFDCHQATHRLLAVANFPAFLTWFRRTYAR